MKKIQLNAKRRSYGRHTKARVHFAFVDDEDYDLVSRYWWYANVTNRGYMGARGLVSGKYIYMHRLILNAPPGLFVDHVNGNRLDNRKANLRVCTVAQNARNSRDRKGSVGYSKYKGVSWHKHVKKWAAQIGVNGRKVYLGYFLTEETAAYAYDTAAKRHHGEFARTNFQ